MDLGLAGRVAMVSGGSRGLGRQAALHLAQEGCSVAICARGREGLDGTVEELRSLGAQAVGIEADVTAEEGTTRFFQQTVEAFGQVDILVNNAGGSAGRGIDATTEED